ncbi:head maturation protease, ClpP-related [Alkaliphilus peptidifermentans]|uniref:ATP-dependent Clp protease proteolytic subunit n=1 Tax=Alkaliphilus peptidifermentans DSM 18978 TaxID=1120976 RepID=A0A1G5EEV3_9FIRM|nr:head maturation protease, ClpP-related [Alkaliphilus peptidifermentans]SCY25477.1 ATP-dependent Clp protease, protease subunit [Alkaliphilus peptidifermentans DSM 18978]
MKFWNWVKNEDGRTLYLDGYIAQESWFEDEVSPREFKAELDEADGDITLWINSPGGDVFAASQIYTMLKEYLGRVTVKIDGIAASAASVIAMAGDEVLMSPTAMLMIHNPSTIVWGEEADMKRGIEMLAEVKESIITAYELKTKLPRNKISQMMDRETWMSANKAHELGFCNKVLYTETEVPENIVNSFMFDRVTITNNFMGKFQKAKQAKPQGSKDSDPKEKGTPYNHLVKRLELLK